MSKCKTCKKREKDGYGCSAVLGCLLTDYKHYEEDTAAVVEIVVAEETRKSAKKIKFSNVQELINADSEDFWAWWARTSPPSRYNDPLPPVEVFEKGGGTKSSRKRKDKTQKMPVVWSWYEL